MRFCTMLCNHNFLESLTEDVLISKRFFFFFFLRVCVTVLICNCKINFRRSHWFFSMQAHFFGNLFLEFLLTFLKQSVWGSSSIVKTGEQRITNTERETVSPTTILKDSVLILLCQTFGGRRGMSSFDN